MVFEMNGGLRKTLPQVFERKAAIADRFFEKVLQRAPDMHRFFPRNYGRRKDLFATFLAQVALGAESPATMESVAQQLASEHRALGLRPEHYRLGNQALTEAFETILADRLSVEDLQLWVSELTRLNQRLAELVS